jgi:hypothetical protein
MAQKTVVLLEDDLDGGTADETVGFSLDGVAYEMDLSTDNATALRAVFGPYTAAARRIGGRPPGTRSGTRSRTGRDQLTAIRAWAAQQGIEINKRGRIPAHVVEQYHAYAARPVATPALAEAPAKGRKATKTAPDQLFSG